MVKIPNKGTRLECVNQRGICPFPAVAKIIVQIHERIKGYLESLSPESKLVFALDPPVATTLTSFRLLWNIPKNLIVIINATGIEVKSQNNLKSNVESTKVTFLSLILVISLVEGPEGPQ